MTSQQDIKILIARSISGTCVVLTTNSSWIACDCENISCSCDDIGIDEPQADVVGAFFLWEGSGKLISNSTPDGYYEPPEPDYTGIIRPVTLEELPGLLAMTSPDDFEPQTETMTCSLRTATTSGHVDEFVRSFRRYDVKLIDFTNPPSEILPKCRISVPAHCADEFLVHALHADIIIGISNETSPP